MGLFNITNTIPREDCLFKSAHNSERYQSMAKAGKGTCGCVLSRKAKDLKEDCPVGWWPKPSA